MLGTQPAVQIRGIYLMSWLLSWVLCAQMRFGGNIGVHAINRTSSAAGLPVQQQVQNRAMLGGLGLNANPLTAGLAGTMAGAPRPGLKPNWQAQRVQSHAQAAVAAQQAAQVQQVRLAFGYYSPETISYGLHINVQIACQV